jgi:hypothetical protein
MYYVPKRYGVRPLDPEQLWKRQTTATVATSLDHVPVSMLTTTRRQIDQHFDLRKVPPCQGCRDAPHIPGPLAEAFTLSFAQFGIVSHPSARTKQCLEGINK